MKKYRVEYSGYGYIEAESKEEAENEFDPDEALFVEWSVDAVQEVQEFTVEV